MKAATATIALVVALALCCGPLLSAAARGVERQRPRKQAMAATPRITGSKADAPVLRQTGFQDPPIIDCQMWIDCMNNELVQRPLIPFQSTGRCVELLHEMLGVRIVRRTFDDTLILYLALWERGHGIPLRQYVDMGMWVTMGQENGCEAPPS
jgi:hypothetical protein